MADTARRVPYYYTTATDTPGEGARLLGALRDAGANLLAFHAFPLGGGETQLDFVPADERAFREATGKAGVSISERKTLFLVEGDDRPGAVAELLKKVGEAGANVTAMDAVISGGRFGALIWVKPADLDKAAKALGAK